MLIASSFTVYGTVATDLGVTIPYARVEAIPVGPSTHDAVMNAADVHGEYQAKLYPGTWLIRLFPAHHSSTIYFYDQSAEYQIVHAYKGGEIESVDFTADLADKAVKGLIQDSEGTTISDMTGIARLTDNLSRSTINPRLVQTAHVLSGSFLAQAVEGEFNLKMELTSDDHMFYQKNIPVSVGISETTSLTVTAYAADAVVKGEIVDVTTNQPVTTLTRVVELWSPTYAYSENGNVGYPGPWDEEVAGPLTIYLKDRYTSSVKSGVWGLRDSWGYGGGYRSLKTPDMVVDTSSGDPLNLYVAPIDAAVSGTLLPPSEDISIRLYDYSVMFEGIGDIEGVKQRAYSYFSDNQFDVELPAGRYLVSVTDRWHQITSHEKGFALPEPFEIELTAGETFTGLEVAMRPISSSVRATIFARTYLPNAYAEIVLSDEAGESIEMLRLLESNTNWAMTEFALDQLADGIWTITAHAFADGAMWSNSSKFVVDGDTQVDLELFLNEGAPVMAELAVDPTLEGSLKLADGTKVIVPTGAVTDTARLTLKLAAGHFLPVGGEFGVVGGSYALKAEHTLSKMPYGEMSFDQPLEVIVPFDLVALQAPTADELKVMFITQEPVTEWGSPTILEGDDIVIDAEAGTVTFSIAEAGYFGLVVSREFLPSPPLVEDLLPHQIYFPFVNP